jgi:hypothetical protein
MKLYEFSFSWCYQAIVPVSFLLHMNKNLLPFIEIYEMMGIIQSFAIASQIQQ